MNMNIYVYMLVHMKAETLRNSYSVGSNCWDQSNQMLSLDSVIGRRSFIAPQQDRINRALTIFLTFSFSHYTKPYFFRTFMNKYIFLAKKYSFSIFYLLQTP